MPEHTHLSLADAQALVMAHARTGEIEEIPLESAQGRVIARDIRANRDLPPYDISAMDGFAVRSADLAAGGAALPVVADIKAGDRPTAAITAGQCVRIMTGAPLPEGADAVVRCEDTRIDADGAVIFPAAVPAGNDIRRRGEVMRRDAVVLEAGSVVTPGVVGVLATVKCARVPVHRRPTVAILATGDELEALEDAFDADRIPESNSYAILAQLQAIGIAPQRLGIAADDPEALREALCRGLDHDILLVSGGSSVGVHDHVRPVLEALGAELHFWRVAMRPGHPLVFATHGDCRIFGLPGNPVSSMVCVEEFVIPLLRRHLGHRQCYRETVPVRLARNFKHAPGRCEFVRVTLTPDAAGMLWARSTGSQSSGDLLSMAMADGLLFIPATSDGLAAGEIARVQRIASNRFQETALP
ncbi:gephyrin-like molybdotransferase Glp [Propionivibrio dicarboxylicus]|uniref:Molybdopterin molybdenumtransferase n=1 Tax=Propionivibrio dicarboxylicus TaxID=83767 RepID=A0A1G8K0R0_9RHOO|nr:gephyrin-like molybdotransferase Glp [Propionivibrio dicarboxylicus]SDI37015.1 molybdopterin molybdotransferase [Propionivibrio dicarboxylicus]